MLGATDPRESEYICAGINHQTWYVDLRWNGRRIGRDELLDAFERHPEISQEEKVRIDVLRRFGVRAPASSGASCCCSQHPGCYPPLLLPSSMRGTSSCSATC
nr:hypothetical protein [uncultured Lichenicoccus sp.]